MSKKKNKNKKYRDELTEIKFDNVEVREIGEEALEQLAAEEEAERRRQEEAEQKAAQEEEEPADSVVIANYPVFEDMEPVQLELELETPAKETSHADIEPPEEEPPKEEPQEEPYEVPYEEEDDTVQLGVPEDISFENQMELNFDAQPEVAPADYVAEQVAEADAYSEEQEAYDFADMPEAEADEEGSEQFDEDLAEGFTSSYVEELEELFYEDVNEDPEEYERRLREYRKESQKTRLERRQKAFSVKCMAISVISFVTVMVLGMLIGFMLFLRPEKSDMENRMLTKFPKFTWQAFVDGSYLSDISTWYADTYPMRDGFIAMDQSIKKLYGMKTDVMMVGGNEVVDDIPDIVTTESPQVPDKPDIADATEELTEEMTGEQTEEELTTAEPVDAPNSLAMEEEIKKQIRKGLYVKEDAAYTIYYFNRKPVESYADTLETAAEALKDTTQIYNILIPNNSGAMLPEDELKKLGGSDQRQAIEYYYSLYHRVKGVRIYDALRAHNDEYLYFRTDHHWTQLGAYYAYQEFCKVKGIESHDLSSFQTMEFTPFLGTFYAQLKVDKMKKNPDTVTAYIPNDTNDMTYWDEKGNEANWKVVSDVTNWSQSAKYTCYIAGDVPLVKIENPKLRDGSSCVIVKESYGNCFVPFLVDHYQTVYVMDFRYYKKNIVDFCRENQIQDLIVMNNITIIANESVARLVKSQYKQ